MTLVRRLLLLDHPQETRFFAFVGAFGVLFAVIYWFASYEIAGTILLGAFGGVGLLMAARLVLGRPRAVAERARPRDAGEAGEALLGPEAGEGTGGGTGGVDRPFLDESGRIPEPTLAPLALGAGISLALTSVVFGPWLLVAGAIPLAWGAWTWFAGARDELDATVEDEGGARSVPSEAAGEQARAEEPGVSG